MHSTFIKFVKRVPGFYVASHPWLDAMGLVKIGFSTDLRARLSMSNYITCFTDSWKYVMTVECRPKDARLLEKLILKIFDRDRIADRELVATKQPKIDTAVSLLISELNIKGRVVNFPKYERQKPKSPVKSIPENRKGTFDDRISSIVDKVTAVIFSESCCSLPSPPQTVSVDVSTVEQQCSVAVASTPTVSDERDDEVFLESVDEEVACAPTSTDYHTINLRDYQSEAVVRSLNDLKENGSSVLQMACRSGKTPVAHAVAVATFNQHKSDQRCHVAFFVPGLSLLRQTAMKLVGYGLPDEAQVILVGSGNVPVQSAGRQLITTTDPLLLKQFLINNPRSIVISTYMSSSIVVAELSNFAEHWRLTVFDEAHRVCGSAVPSSFNRALLAPRVGMRLFMTATPTYDTPIRMDNRLLFGGVSYRFYLREGINKGVVNDFEVGIMLGDNLDDDQTMCELIAKAAAEARKMLVYCKNIAHAESLSKKFIELNPRATVFCAHSRKGVGVVAAALKAFIACETAILFNVRLFQEGVEVSDLNAVFFAAPRYSPRDIIQSICRPLNRVEGKPKSKIFIPARFDSKRPADDPVNLENFSTLIPFTDALMSEDPTLFEYLIDPAKNDYNIRIVGMRRFKLSDAQICEVVLPSIRRGIRFTKRDCDRLHKADRLPWKTAFAELRRIVTDCNRYPKINDAWIIGDARVPLHTFYRYCRDGYRLFLEGNPAAYLEPHQLRDLETLPSWRTYGCNGPYPWKECFATLKEYVDKHGRFPLLDIHKGGFVGLDATPFERLAGALCNVNQQDKFAVFSVSSERAADLDALCSRHCLTWRKPRKPNGELKSKNETSCITVAYSEFKRRFDSGDVTFLKHVEDHFPGYPNKHYRMESLAVQAAGTAPPRLKRRSEAQLKRMRSKGIVETVRKVVVCRNCRVEVNPSDWDSHVRSRSHLDNINKKQTFTIEV